MNTKLILLPHYVTYCRSLLLHFCGTLCLPRSPRAPFGTILWKLETKCGAPFLVVDGRVHQMQRVRQNVSLRNMDKYQHLHAQHPDPTTPWFQTPPWELKPLTLRVGQQHQHQNVRPKRRPQQPNQALKHRHLNLNRQAHLQPNWQCSCSLPQKSKRCRPCWVRILIAC